MRIESIHLRNFKRFTDTVIKDMPSTAKLVVVVGPNGCGKSSLFDALLLWHRVQTAGSIHDSKYYFKKDDEEKFSWTENVVVSLHGGVKPAKGSFYIRTAYRNDADFSISSFKKLEAPSDRYSVDLLIEDNKTVSTNYQRLVYETMDGLYDIKNNEKTVLALREELIGAVRASMKRVFGNLLLNNIADPLGEGSFFFQKGTAKSYHYKNLSGGEKSAFDLLLDLHIKKKYFPDAIYCIDEIETHLHTKAQGKLLKELARIVPELSQLWVTTHSLGVLRAAQEMASENSGEVCVIDFDGIDPDISQEIVPSNLGRVSWEKLLSIALDDLSLRIAPKTVIVCEGSSVGKRRKDFDAEIYNQILGVRNPGVLFISGGSSNQVNATGVFIHETLGFILPTSKFLSLVDRDDTSDTEVKKLESRGTIVLSLRNLESYLFADDVIMALIKRDQKMELLADALQIKIQAIENSIARGNAPDDLKSAAGDIYIGLKKLLNLQKCGNNTDAFMRDTLAPLIVPSMKTYEKLASDIFGKLTE